MYRDDLSNKLIHLVRGETIEEACGKFEKILEQGQLRGGTGYIKGGYQCVCFTETPISKLAQVLTRPGSMRYQPIGVMLDRNYVSELGGRQVIYQPDQEYELLGESHRFRHVRHEIGGAEEIDFSWEREWRVHTDTVCLPPKTPRSLYPTGAGAMPLRRRIWKK